MENQGRSTPSCALEQEKGARGEGGGWGNAMSTSDLLDAHEYRLEPQPGPNVEVFYSGGDGQGEMRVRARWMRRLEGGAHVAEREGR
jgi:hypothetical protein